MNEQYENSGNSISNVNRSWSFPTDIANTLPVLTNTRQAYGGAIVDLDETNVIRKRFGLEPLTSEITTTEALGNGVTYTVPTGYVFDPNGYSIPYPTQPPTVYPDQTALLMKRIEELERRLAMKSYEDWERLAEQMLAKADGEDKDEEPKVSRKFRKVTEETK